ncbi:MAG: (deoxy)nucleoside triphosphate pyrophosphohydrolase [Cytophagales bacterium]|nr:(deoxy)nucleoside triphosphate pyrophosphohydrolase [Bernardetiaceae bacterium]MDW8211447.1 (deoxy)nucleoside triphosphate pyrophosphohydrolase [Cytophagales bacterium]
MPSETNYCCAVLPVACAVIISKGRVLAAQRALHRSHGGLWEFPGGKIHPNETAEACISREIAEELGARVRLVARLPDCLYHYPHQSVCLIPFVCYAEDPAAFQPLEHQAIHWCTDEELTHLNWCAADRLVLQQYIAWKNATEKTD